MDPVADIDVYECEACGSRSDDLGFKRPFNSVEGRVRLSSAAELMISSIEVTLQGSQLTTVVAYRQSTYPSEDLVALSGNHNFINISYRPAIQRIVKGPATPGSHCYSVDFSFLIPETTDRYYDDLLPQCQLLPPSLDDEGSPKTPSSNDVRPRAEIVYTLQVAVEYRLAGTADSIPLKTVNATKTMGLLPYNDAQPPTNIASFPHEFITHVDVPIKKSFLGGHLGTISITTREPLPLVYSSATWFGSTRCVLTLSVDAVPNVLRHLRCLSLRVKPAIRAKTFYSVEGLLCVPKQTFLTQHGLLRLRDSILKLEPQSCDELEWRYIPPRIERDGPPDYYESLSSDVAPEGNMTQTGNGKWHTTITVPIAPPQMLLPTFCSKLIARSYTLLLPLTISGIANKGAEFEVPLQVIHPRPLEGNGAIHSADLTSNPCLGPAKLSAEDQLLPPYEASARR